MQMTIEALRQIELDSALAPHTYVQHNITLVKQCLQEHPQEVREYAAALLLKLEHLVGASRVASVSDATKPAEQAVWSQHSEPFRIAA